METLTLEQVEQKIKEYTELRQKLAKEQGKPTVETVFSRLFRYPGIVGASWTQYTPYFNDGEPCEFNVYSDIRLYTADDDLELGYYDEDNGFDSYEIPKSIPEVYVRPEPDPYYTRVDSWTGRDRMDQWNAYQEREERRVNEWRDNGWTDELIRGFIEDVHTVEKWLSNHEDFLYDIFGDHVQVVVSKSGVETHEYSHD